MLGVRVLAGVVMGLLLTAMPGWGREARAAGSARTGAAAGSVAEGGFARRRGTEILDGEGRPLRMRGTSVGNWLVTEGYLFGLQGGPQSKAEIERLVAELLGPEGSERFWREFHDRWVTAADVRLLHAAGVNTLRVPLDWAMFQTEDAEGFRLVDRLVGWCRAEGISVVLDLHAAPGGQTGTNIDNSVGYPWLYRSPEAQAQLVAVWQRLARHYRGERAVLGYELLNEPIPQFAELQPFNADLEPIYKRVTAAIRAVDARHMIFLGGARWDTNFTVFGPPFDANTVYTFHTYWSPPVQATIQPFLDFRTKYGVPLWLGESGENTDAWIETFRTLLDEDGIGWTFWPYKKLGKASAFVTVTPPEGWDQIVAFAKLPGGTGSELVEARIKARPAQAVIDKAFAGLLENIELERATVNPGYLRALGLTVPKTK